ncbi:zinc-binding dehydrogenase [Asaia lannensis]|uniref:Alcohol dehydrogenase catalytic domain-containing protein n=1 Tax=Asaia lannensis NBRC 102526 TaxID=1307926 RepID=A0ABT1CH06_9PROT|nr:alcohol dehydrogenase catalytic domain-containing protein [Asaia lannensis]MCO6160162.1 alcohol dehydrogenase catalytic domain-containing protein [Asaia lannensis NBRC 102526]GBQ99742.1 threonine dehydrogenase [Asaia lannensis NBRC 102526]
MNKIVKPDLGALQKEATSVALPEKMMAVVAYEPGDYRWEEVDVPRAGPDDIIIEVETVGICAGDIKCFLGAPSFWGDKEQPRYVKPPMIPGHEFIGRAVEIGENLRGQYKVGDRLISEQIVPCDDCRYCKGGQYWMCERHDLYGFQNNTNGAMAKYMRFPKTSRTHRVPEDMPAEAAALIEPYACSVHAVNRANIQLDDVVVLAGAGTLGLGMVGAARLKNPSKLIVLDTKQDRLDLAKKFGADIVMNPLEEDVVAKVKELTDGYGCDVYIEATGHPSSVRQGLHMIRKLGRFVEFSVFGDEVTCDWSIISDRKELDVLGAHLGPYCYPFTIAAIADGRLPVEGVVTHSLPLAQWKEGFDLMKKGDKSIKTVLIP